MKEFTSCFIGIPLPDEYLREFANLLEKIKVINPDLEIIDPATPHITIYYLDAQPEDNLDSIKKVVERHISLVRNNQLTVGSMDIFGGDNPTVLFLNVKYPPALVDFNKIISKDLVQFIAEDNNLPFHPHMTVARCNITSQVSWRKTRPSIETEMTQINWLFPIKEVVIYGVDSTKSPEQYEKLISIPA